MKSRQGTLMGTVRRLTSTESRLSDSSLSHCLRNRIQDTRDDIKAYLFVHGVVASAFTVVLAVDGCVSASSGALGVSSFQSPPLTTSSRSLAQGRHHGGLIKLDGTVCRLFGTRAEVCRNRDFRSFSHVCMHSIVRAHRVETRPK